MTVYYNFDNWYKAKLQEMLGSGVEQYDKLALFGQVLTLDLDYGLPLLWCKPTPWRKAIAELQWFVSNSYDLADLEADGVTWWRPWTKTLPDGKVTDITLPYKKHRLAYTRIKAELLAKRFDSTRLYCSLWPEEQMLDQAILPPCALSYQVTVNEKLGTVSMIVHQRSADLLCGVPSNVIQYAYLLHCFAQIAGLRLGLLQFTFGNLHIYKSHLESESFAELMLRTSNGKATESMDFVQLTEDLELELTPVDELELTRGYRPAKFLKFPVAEVHTEGYKSSY